MCVNLLNYQIHQPTENFIQTLYTFFMNPQIIQPTRITDHTATLMDNIFFNSIDFETISCNRYIRSFAKFLNY